MEENKEVLRSRSKSKEGQTHSLKVRLEELENKATKETQKLRRANIKMMEEIKDLELKKADKAGSSKQCEESRENPVQGNPSSVLKIPTTPMPAETGIAQGEEGTTTN